ncbi:MAG: TatD family deoxyribonuclease [Puniceicoccaceae bacterium]|nr:MAG: TatD family deoxyribonuclease [Puniceicoccaceae bacterium]
MVKTIGGEGLDDAHNHLQDPLLAGRWPEVREALAAVPVRRAAVNGTCEADWPAVERLAADCPWVHPSFGLHPWKVKERSGGWLRRLRALLERHPGVGVGEIGLDRWIEGHDLEEQAAVFRSQLELASELERPATLHCLRAWGRMREEVDKGPRPRPGLLLHAYGGPAEMVESFVAAGAYFSFNAAFLEPRKERTREAFTAVPLDRLLIETDAPAMPPPEALDRWGWRDPASGRRVNHPASLGLALESLARIRKMDTKELARVLRDNFSSLFGAGG